MTASDIINNAPSWSEHGLLGLVLFAVAIGIAWAVYHGYKFLIHVTEAHQSERHEWKSSSERQNTEFVGALERSVEKLETAIRNRHI